MPAIQHPTLLISSHELEDGQSKGFIIHGTNLFILRHQGRVVAYINSCPHRKVPLEWLPNQFLDYDKQFIHCATHGALFTIDNGLCISGPCHQKSLTSLNVEERDGKIYCSIPESTESPGAQNSAES
jgi:nitrite reductase/ring-hydroxylating ferredoxin subunit